MKTAQQRIVSLEYSLVAILLFVIPFFFLPLTFEFFATNKMYLLGYSSLIILILASFRLLIQKNIVWERNILDVPVVLFVSSVGLSTLFASENPVQSLLNPHTGLITLLALTIMYFYISRQEWEKRSINLVALLIYSACILAIFTCLVFFGLFKNAWLPESLQFLKNPLFSPAGTVFDLLAFLGYFLIYQILRIVYSEKAEVTISYATIAGTVIISAGVAFALIMLVQMSANPTFITEFAQFPISLKAAGSIFSSLGSFIFGVGIDDFSAAYTKVKDIQSNLGELWQIDSFNLSRSALLHILTETGILGLMSFLGMISALIYKIVKSSYPQKLGPLLLTIYVTLAFIFFPVSLMLYFLLFITFAFTTCDLSSFEKNQTSIHIKLNKKSSAPVLYTVVLILFSLTIAGGYYLTRAYMADASFRKSFDAVARNDANSLYDFQRNAVVLNPYIEQYRAQLAKTNVVIANDVATTAQNSGQEITLQQKQIITEAIQAAIAQAKAAATLNPSKANNWEALGTVYANVTGIANGSPQWAISAYTRAISLDPSNAKYHSKLGTVYYLTGRYEDAINSFARSSELKPDWASVWYNMAWSYYKAGNTDKAIDSMTKAISRIDRTTSPTDYQQALTDLNRFRQNEQ